MAAASGSWAASRAASALLLTGMRSMLGKFWSSQLRHWAKDCWWE